MGTYLMFGSYSQDSIRKISAKRTDDMVRLIEKYGGKLTAGYALLGEKDLLLLVDLPTTEQAMKTSVALSRMLGIGFSTTPAVSIEAFDKLTESL
ncbi:MAG: GYD domain-containing protein [Chloroflexi bacterium]|nr:GYD domain-containing protein [Chloroflexota bacterium]